MQLRRFVMLLPLQIVAVCQVAVAMSLALAHALELPGKMRLDRDTYVAMQPIYYPGFTFGAGIGEAGGMVTMLILLLIMPRAGQEFLWTVVAFISLIAMHVAYWLFTHPVNKFWLKGVELRGFGKGFFRFDPVNRATPTMSADDDWKRFRNRWEYSHVLRAVLAGFSFVCLVIAVAI
jgi:hypothetical protein